MKKCNECVYWEAEFYRSWIRAYDEHGTCYCECKSVNRQGCAPACRRFSPKTLEELGKRLEEEQ
jgi:hypothetical protein